MTDRGDSPARRIGVIAGVVLALLVPGAVASTAQEPDGGAVVIILDASGSMNRVDGNGVVLIDGAKGALERLIAGLPERSQVGLMVYGHRVPNDDRVNGCKDIELVVPVGTLDRQAMLDAVSGVAAKGFTPIGTALEEAAAALPDGRGTVILVSDGEDTCAPPDPCEVAAGLLERGVDIRVHTVGFFLEDDDEARGQLQCIADATGGTYHEVDAIDALAAELGTLVSSALPDDVGPVTIPLDGGTTLESAPLIPFATAAWPPDALQSSVEGVIRPGETRWYAFEVDDGPLGAALGASVLELVPGSVPGDVVRISIVDGDGLEYQTGSSRFGRVEIDLSTVTSGVEATLGTTASFSGFDVWWAEDEAVADAVVPLGLDQAAYDALVREMLLRPAPPPLVDGRYYIGIQWDAESSDVERVVNLGASLWPHSEVKHLAYVEADGSVDADAPMELIVPAASDTWLPPQDEAVTHRGGFLGAIRTSEPSWYAVDAPVGSTITVRAFLNRPQGAEPSGAFRVELSDASGGDVGSTFGTYPSDLQLDDADGLEAEDDLGHPIGVAPRPLVGAMAADVDGPVMLAFVWDGPAGETGEVEFVVDLQASDAYGGGASGDEARAEEPVVVSTTSPAPVAGAPESTGTSNGIPTVPLTIAAVVLVVGLAVFVPYRTIAGRRNHPS